MQSTTDKPLTAIRLNLTAKLYVNAMPVFMAATYICYHKGIYETFIFMSFLCVYHVKTSRERREREDYVEN
jgi:hypothetical protein